MYIKEIEKHYEEEITIGGDFRIIRLRNVLIGSLNEEEQDMKTIKEKSEKLWKAARQLTKIDIEKTLEKERKGE